MCNSFYGNVISEKGSLGKAEQLFFDRIDRMDLERAKGRRSVVGGRRSGTRDRRAMGRRSVVGDQRSVGVKSE